MRAADLSLQAGFPYFTVVEEKNEKRKDSSVGITISMPKNEILVQFLKEKPAGVLAFDAAFLIRTVKEKYKIK